MYQVPTQRLKKYRVPSRLPSSPENGDSAKASPESLSGKLSTEKAAPKSEAPRLRIQEQPRSPIGFRIRGPLKDLPRLRPRRSTLKDSKESVPLSAHPSLQIPEATKTVQDEKQAAQEEKKTTGSSESWEKISGEACPAPSTTQAQEKSGDTFKDPQSHQQLETSIQTTSDECSFESCIIQPSIGNPKAPPIPPGEARPDSPTIPGMSPVVSHKSLTGEATGSWRRPSTPLERISKISRKFSNIAMRRDSGEKVASTANMTTLRTIADSGNSGSRRVLVKTRDPIYPPWERSLDVTWERDPDVTWSDLKQLMAFKTSLIKFIQDSKHLPVRNMVDTAYFRLPDAVRYRICKHLVGDGGRKAIRMNPVAAFRRVWPDDYFESLQSVLQSLERYTSVSSGFRADILVTLFTTRHFHVVWSPYVMPLTSPAAVYFMRKYSGLMQHITLEFDLTKLGFAAEPAAHALKPGIQNIYPRVDEFVHAQKERDRCSTIFNLRILVRRYYGNRESGGNNNEDEAKGKEGREAGPRNGHASQKAEPYCADEHLKIMDSLKCLRGMVERVRIVGCSEEYTSDLIRYLWKDMPEGTSERMKHCRRTAPSTLYPFLPGQLSYLDYGPVKGKQIVKHPRTFVSAYGGGVNEVAMERKLSPLGEIMENEDNGSTSDNGRG